MAASRVMMKARPGDRAEVIYWANYYDPNVLVEMVRR